MKTAETLHIICSLAVLSVPWMLNAYMTHHLCVYGSHALYLPEVVLRQPVAMNEAAR